MKVTYRLNKSSHSSKWKKEQPFILNRTSCVRMLTKCESNLPAEHKFTQLEVEVASGEKKNYSLITHLNTAKTLNHIFRSSQLHQCDQGMLPNWKSFFSLICLHSCHFYHKPCNQGTQGMQMCVRSKQQHTLPEMLIYKFSEAS